MAGKRVATPRYRVLSGRVSDEEYEEFQRLAAKAHMSLSKLVRDVMVAWKEGKYDVP